MGNTSEQQPSRTTRPSIAAGSRKSADQSAAIADRNAVRAALGRETETQASGASLSTPAPLPYRDRIEAALGGEDLGSVRAHVGGQAARMAALLDAEAFAFGEDVFFRAAPDLALAAHEAVHVVQQRRGASATERHLESEAERIAGFISAGGHAVVAGDAAAPTRIPLRKAAPSTARPDAVTLQLTSLTGYTTNLLELFVKLKPALTGVVVPPAAPQYLNPNLPAPPDAGEASATQRKETELKLARPSPTPSNPLATVAEAQRERAFEDAMIGRTTVSLSDETLRAAADVVRRLRRGEPLVGGAPVEAQPSFRAPEPAPEARTSSEALERFVALRAQALEAETEAFHEVGMWIGTDEGRAAMKRYVDPRDVEFYEKGSGLLARGAKELSSAIATPSEEPRALAALAVGAELAKVLVYLSAQLRTIAVIFPRDPLDELKNLGPSVPDNPPEGGGSIKA